MSVQQQLERHLGPQPYGSGASGAVLRLVALVALLAIAIMAAGGPAAVPATFRRLRASLYCAARGAQKARTLDSVRGWATVKSGLVRLYYTPADGDIAPLVACYAGEAYASITRELGYESPGELPVILYPSFEALQESIPGGDPGRSVGVSWAGVVGVVTPKAWGRIFEPSGDQVRLFYRYNPLYHEITHSVLDEMVSGNYPRWFSEGLAQVQEYRVTGYIWEEPGDNASGPGDDLALRRIERAFHSEDTLNAAYEKSMWVTARVMDSLGRTGFTRLVELLRRGWGFEAALRSAAGVDYDDLEFEWQRHRSAAGLWPGRIDAEARGKNREEG